MSNRSCRITRSIDDYHQTGRRKSYGRSNSFSRCATLSSLPAIDRYAVIATISTILIVPFLDRTRLYRASAFEPTEAEMEALQKFIQVQSPPSDGGEDDDAALEPSASVKEEEVKSEPEPGDLPLDHLTINDETVEPSTKMLKMVRNNFFPRFACIQLNSTPSSNISKIGCFSTPMTR